jgi:hypothetical protein
MRSRRVEKRAACKILGEELEGKKTLERPRLRWVNNIKMALGEVGLGGMKWFHLA